MSMIFARFLIGCPLRMEQANLYSSVGSMLQL